MNAVAILLSGVAGACVLAMVEAQATLGTTAADYNLVPVSNQLTFPLIQVAAVLSLD